MLGDDMFRGSSLMLPKRLRTDLLFTYNGASMDSGVKTSERNSCCERCCSDANRESQEAESNGTQESIPRSIRRSIALLESSACVSANRLAPAGPSRRRSERAGTPARYGACQRS